MPGLGDLPILGSLFRSVEYKKGETELLVLGNFGPVRSFLLDHVRFLHDDCDIWSDWARLIPLALSVTGFVLLLAGGWPAWELRRSYSVALIVSGVVAAAWVGTFLLLLLPSCVA